MAACATPCCRRRSSADLLEALERTNGFVVPLDRRGEWYRYHHLFGELLRNELERSEPDAASVLNGRAMAWCIANDLTEAAVLYGQAAGETDTVADLLEGLALPLYFDGRMQTAEEWFGWFGEDDLAQHPVLAVYGAWIRVLTGRPDDAERLLALADGATSTGPLPDGSATIEPWIATLRAHMMRDGVERALADADLALDQLPPGSWWIPGSLRMRGVAHGLLGATDRETEDLRASITAAQALGAPGDDVPLAQALLALRAAKQGAWGEAAERARAAQAIVDEKGLGDYATTAVVHAATARVALHEARHGEARAALARAHRLRPQLDHGLPWMAVQVGLELTRAHLALGEASAARTILTETERVLELRPDLGTLVEEARELGDRVAASSELGRCLGDEPDGCGAPAAAVPRHPSHVPGDREQAVHLAQHGKDRSGRDLPQVRGLIAQSGDRARDRGRAPGRARSTRRRGQISSRKYDAPAGRSR